MRCVQGRVSSSGVKIRIYVVSYTTIHKSIAGIRKGYCTCRTMVCGGCFTSFSSKHKCWLGRSSDENCLVIAHAQNHSLTYSASNQLTCYCARNAIGHWCCMQRPAPNDLARSIVRLRPDQSHAALAFCLKLCKAPCISTQMHKHVTAGVSHPFDNHTHRCKHREPSLPRSLWPHDVAVCVRSSALGSVLGGCQKSRPTP